MLTKKFSISSGRSISKFIALAILAFGVAAVPPANAQTFTGDSQLHGPARRRISQRRLDFRLESKLIRHHF